MVSRLKPRLLAATERLLLLLGPVTPNVILDVHSLMQT